MLIVEPTLGDIWILARECKVSITVHGSLVSRLVHMIPPEIYDDLEHDSKLDFDLLGGLLKSFPSRVLGYSNFTGMGSDVPIYETKPKPKPKYNNLWDSISLFDLGPYTSDIDIVVNASEEDTELFKSNIYEELLWANCFRWQILTNKDYEPYENAKKYSATIPSRQMKISYNWKKNSQVFIDNNNGYEEIRTRKLTYKPPKLFHQSPLYKNEIDLKIFSILILLQSAIELSEGEDKEFEDLLTQKHLETIIELIGECRNTEIDKLVNNNYLEMRFMYLLMNCFSRNNFIDFESSGFKLNQAFHYFFEELEKKSPALMQQIHNIGAAQNKQGKERKVESISPSSLMNGKKYRFLNRVQQWITNEERVMASFEGVWEAKPETRLELGNNTKILAVNSTTLHASATKLEKTGLGGDYEFVYFSFIEDELLGQSRLIDVNNLSMFIAVKSMETNEWVPFSPPTIVDRFADRLLVKTNVLSLFKMIPQKTNLEARFFLLEWQGEENE